MSTNVKHDTNIKHDKNIVVFGLFNSRSAALAFLLPAAARASIRARRTDTSENSEATKKPFVATRNTTPISFRNTIIEVARVVKRSAEYYR